MAEVILSTKEYNNTFKLKLFAILFDFSFRFVIHNFKYFKFSKI